MIKKQNHYQGLHLTDTYIEDTENKYFHIYDIPSVLPAGKTAIRINGSSYLKLNSEVKVEVLNAENKVIYSEYPKYLEGSSRLISVFVYPDELYGSALLTIVGQLKDDRVPPEWRGHYNCRWQQQILIDPSLRNDDKIRFYRVPVIDAQEIYTPYLQRTYSTSSNVEYKTYSSGKIQGDIVGDYYLYLSGGSFRREMEGAQLTVSHPIGYGKNHIQSYETKIKKVFSQYTALPEVPYIETASLPPAYRAIKNRLSPQETLLTISREGWSPFKSSDYTIRWKTEPSYSYTENYRSFAKLSINDMDTFSGDVYSVKLFAKSIGSTKDYEPIGDLILESTELLKNSNIIDDVKNRYGYLYSQDTIDTYWTASSYNNSPSNLIHSSEKLLDAMYVSGSPSVRQLNSYSIIYPTTQSIDFHENTEYNQKISPTLASVGVI